MTTTSAARTSTGEPRADEPAATGDASATAARRGGDATARGADTARAFNEALGELVRVIQFRDRDRACCHDLSVTQCYALKGVVDAGRMTVNELAAYLYLDKSTASRVANGLVDKRMLEKQRDPADGRIVHLLATERGLGVHRAIESELLAEYDELLEDFDPAFRSAIVKLMRRLRRTFRARVDVSSGSCCVVRGPGIPASGARAGADARD